MKRNELGQIFIFSMIVMGLVVINAVLLFSGAVTFLQSSQFTTEKIQAVNLAEAGIDQAVASLNATAGSFNPSPDYEVVLGPGTYTIKISSLNPATKLIEATGYVPNKANPKARKTVTIQAAKGIGAAFNYGVQVGDGGIEMENNAKINGSVYSNGNVKMENNSRVSGDVYVAGGSQPQADQQTDCDQLVLGSCQDLIFGQNSSSEVDVAQSFQPTTSSVINKVFLKLRKVGNPPDLTVRILGNSGTCPNCVPDKGQVLTSGILSSSRVSNNYGWVDVAFSPPPTLTAGATYWVMLDTSPNATNYWSWQADSLQQYSRGQAAYSADWQVQTPVWHAILADLSFQSFMGGVATSISGSSGVTIGGDAHANTIGNLTISRSAYYQVINPPGSVQAQAYFPNSADPAVLSMPLSEPTIQQWKNQAESNGSETASISGCPGGNLTLQSKKYIGDMSLPNSCTVTVFHPIWVTGNLNLGNGVTVKLDNSLGDSSGSFIVSGRVTFGNTDRILGTATPGSHLILISEFNSRDDPEHRLAINVGNTGNSGIVYSNLGAISISNGNNLTEVTAWKLELENGANVTYDTGLASAFFSSGPGGSFSVIKGTYQAK